MSSVTNFLLTESIPVGWKSGFQSDSVSPQPEDKKQQTLRPLSPHLPVYQPQLNATLSITNRISGAFLATMEKGAKLEGILTK
ncbi:Succinate dehydrogenase/Fumarate reductase, transmembrane subunit [Corchorus capsularis]|uniref:Succinate dehydrogenase/Fumarate reductase, transmembrane subunit n=1 Tax=Corchorus capsularis TaxID=210143 RepID=A0A1R3GGS9_COCAP|nr:Succinate dehydrogenase/Fumarate reductase, transmembrane subunit [Corchorus capsularis]